MAVTTCAPVRASTCTIRASIASTSTWLKNKRQLPQGARRLYSAPSFVTRLSNEWLSELSTERERHVDDAVQRVAVVRRAFAKAQRRVQRARSSHRRQRVEFQLAVPDRRCLGEYVQHERSPQAAAQRIGTNVETLHFADQRIAFRQRSQCDAAGRTKDGAR